MNTMRRSRTAAEHGLRRSPDEHTHLRWVGLFQALRAYEEALAANRFAVGDRLTRVRAVAADLVGEDAHALDGLSAATPAEAVDQALADALWRSLGVRPALAAS
ncbi:hypothetical protein [Nocardiopsis sp. NRRL B-16309]|uniref:hypothetical protein n=1 Tax=Nocardiopsis sp. NRRL B-16309 TaxID=1519494 RepID=UPI0006AE445A|nr:hypothetical protein [Nocardiopsis sp. NRRL B-16309]KOX11889.1 hypothetical protein ADL05_22930 [Nocardiopsis sp. NRRL B-16309]